MKQSIKKLDLLRKEFYLKNIIIKKPNNILYIKEYTPTKNIKNENIVVTQEKEKERALHHFAISNVIQKFTLNNYYHLNFLLKDLTYSKLYYQPFIDKKGLEKQALEEKKVSFNYSMKESIKVKEELQFLKKIINKIRKNQAFIIKSMKNQALIYNDNYKDYYYKKKFLFI